MDIYAWLAHRLHRVHNRNGDEISWNRLKEQFGHEYADTAQGRKNFRKEFETALADVLRLIRLPGLSHVSEMGRM